MPEPIRTKASLPTDTLAILFTDIEGSTVLWEQDGARMSQALAAHDALARCAVEGHRGTVVKTTGDGMHAVFDDALDALAATVDLQHALADPVATNGVPLRVRCGVHAGVVERRDNDYFGSPVNRAARIMSAAHGGQVLLSQVVVDGVRDRLPAAIELRDLGKVRLKDLSAPEHVFQVVHPNLRKEFPALRSLEATPNNLPQQVTSFIGRALALAELQRLLAKTRLLTLTGSGGCGKTRLGLQVAAEALEHFPDGVWLVELAPLADPAFVPQTVATLLGLKGERDKPIIQVLTAHLKDKRLLLLLDNCEHLLHACAQLVDALLRQCPRVEILASSREALGIAGEQVYRVPSLSLPDPKQANTPVSVATFEAVQLFIERALLARLDFAVNHQNAATLASICLRLDGIPLAIELAAARVRSLSLEEINRKLDQRFQLLTGGSRAAMPRQQTLRSLIDWSYDLLTDVEQAMLRRVSVFAGGWTLQASEQVCTGDGVADQNVLELLTSLCDKSLVAVDQNEGGYRYRLLETIRQYAGDRLRESGEEARWRDRHLAWVLALAEEAFQALVGPQQALWIDRMARELDNVRAALQRAIDEKAADAFRIAPNLALWWVRRASLSEARQWFYRLLDSIPRDRAPRDRARALGALGNMAMSQCDYHEAERLFQESDEFYRALGEVRGSAYQRTNLAVALVARGQYAAAEPLLMECVKVARSIGDDHLVAVNVGNLAIAVYERGDVDRSASIFEEALALARSLGDGFLMSQALGVKGDRELRHGDLKSAEASFREILAIARELKDPLTTILGLERFAELAVATHAPRRAATMWGVIARLREEIGVPIPLHEEDEYKHTVAAASAALGDAEFDRAWHEGRATKTEDAVQYALGEPVPDA